MKIIKYLLLVLSYLGIIHTSLSQGSYPWEELRVMTKTHCVHSELPDSRQYLIRYPDVTENKIVFSCNNDLWIASLDEGLAKRITRRTGHEIYPKFSPDGSKIVFTADYNGTKSVYLTDTCGGYLKRLTYHPSDNIVLDWLDNETVLFRTNREYPFHTWELYKINIEKEIPEKIQFDNVGMASYSPELNMLAYNRLAAENQDYHERKRYTGGQAQDIWLGDLNREEYKQITDFAGTDNFPMWKGNCIYFTSDRNNGTLNIYKYRLNDDKITQLTYYTDFDVKYPSMGNNHIVYQNAADIYLFDLLTEKSEKITLNIPSDSIYINTGNINAADYTETYNISPDGKFAVFEIRGEIVLYAPESESLFINLTKTSNSREKNPVWSPDGKWIAFFSDRSGEEELYLIEPFNNEPWKQITHDGSGFRMNPLFSPDSRHLIFHDKYMRLNMVEIETGEIKVIDRGEYDDSWFRWGIQDYCWSPDSRWIAYTKMEQSLYESIFLYSLEQGKSYRVTDSQYNDFSPSFSRDGKYLFFLSQRNFDPIMGQVDDEYVFLNMTRPYAFILEEGAISPFSYNKSKSIASSNEKINIGTDDIDKRIVEIPVSPGNLFRLEAVENGFLYMRKTRNEFYKYQSVTDENGNTNYDLYKYDVSEKENKFLMEGISQYHVSHNDQKILYKEGDDFGIKDINTGQKGGGSIDLNAVRINIDRKEEFLQIFNEAWRLQRDWFYDENMHGLDWDRTGDKYRNIVRFCTTREDLNYVLSEMMAELSCSHTYVGGGELEYGNYINTGLMGIDFVCDQTTGFPVITKIIPTDNWNGKAYSPFYEPGCPVKTGDYILEIDGHEIERGDNIFKYLQGKGGRIIEVTYNDIPDPESAQKYKFRALYSEEDLRYNEWVRNNIEHVEKESGEQAGYIHLPYLEKTGLGIFAKYFHPQYYKKGLIIDVRYNRGGFASFMVLRRLKQAVDSYKQPREGKYFPEPERAFNGKLVLLINEYAGSAPEIFAEGWRNSGLGPIIGKTSWGGAVGTEGHQHLVDGGRVSAPQFPRFNTKGEWLIEGKGVEPDITVINMPSDIINGHDAQLEKAIEIILKQMNGTDSKMQKVPDYPDKSKKLSR